MPDPSERPSQDQPTSGEPIPQYAYRAPAPGFVVPPPLQPRRPSSPLAIGITLIVGSALLSLYLLVGVAALFIARSSSAGGVGSLGASIPPAQTILNIALAVLSLAALAAGIGLVRYRAWARTLSIAWAVAALADIVVTPVVNFVYVWPATRRIMESANLPAGSERVIQTGMTVSIVFSIIWAVVLAVTPILILIFMTRPAVKQSCT